MYNATDFLSTSSVSFFGETKQQLLSYPSPYKELVEKAFYLIACRLGIFSKQSDSFEDSPKLFTSLVDMKLADIDENLEQWLAFSTIGLCPENSEYPMPNHHDFSSCYDDLAYDASAFRSAAYNALSGDYEKPKGCTGHCSTCECYGGAPGECMSGELEEVMAYYYASITSGDTKALESFSGTDVEDICLYYLDEAIDFMGDSISLEEEVTENNLYCSIINHYSFFSWVSSPTKKILGDDWSISTFYHPHFHQVSAFLFDVASGKYSKNFKDEEHQKLITYYQRHVDIYDFLRGDVNELGEDCNIIYGCMPFLYAIESDASQHGAIFTFLENTSYELTKEVFLFKELINIVSECWSKYRHLILDTEVAITK